MPDAHVYVAAPVQADVLASLAFTMVQIVVRLS